MKQKIALFAALLVPTLLIFANLPVGEAVKYEHDDRIEKVVVEKRKQSSVMANYLVKICADDKRMPLGELVLHSDMESVTLNFNRVLNAGDCTYAGAVLKNIDLDSLGATLIDK